MLVTVVLLRQGVPVRYFVPPPSSIAGSPAVVSILSGPNSLLANLLVFCSMHGHTQWLNRFKRVWNTVSGLTALFSQLSSQSGETVGHV